MKNMLFWFVCLVILPHTGFASQKDDDDGITKLKKENQKLLAIIQELEREIQALKTERDTLKRELRTERKKSKAAERDLFEVGASWSGSRFVRGVKQSQAWRLVVTSREGSSFKGEIQFVSPDKKSQQIDVSGTAPAKENGRVVFKTTAVGVFQQSFSGSLKGEQISLSWEGTTVRGRRVVGTANLAR